MNNTDWIARQGEKRDNAEVRVLGTALTAPDLLPQLAAKLDPSLFRREAHRIVADAVWGLVTDGKPVDVDSVTDMLIGAGTMDTVGGPAALWDLFTSGEMDLRAADELLELERRRQVWQACHDGTVQVANPAVEPDDVAADVAAALHSRETFDESGPLTTDELLDLDVPDWLVDGILPAGLSLIFGAPKTGKSYVALSVAWAVANGLSWFSRGCGGGEPAPVLYLAGEGVADLRLRVESLIEATDHHPGGNLRWWTRPLSLSRDRDGAKLRLEVERIRPRLVVVDTWRRFSGLVDENDAGSAAAAVGVLEDLTTQGVSVLVVHHTNAEGGIRGSTVLPGAVESAVRTVWSDGRLIFSSQLSRRGAGFDDLRFKWSRSGPDFVLQETFG